VQGRCDDITPLKQQKHLVTLDGAVHGASLQADSIVDNH